MIKKGKGVVMIHWATEAIKGDPGNKFIEWMGGFCDLHWSVNPHWVPELEPQKHEIWNGVKPYSANPTVRKAVANGETQHVAWAYERADGGRGFLASPAAMCT